MTRRRAAPSWWWVGAFTLAALMSIDASAQRRVIVPPGARPPETTPSDKPPPAALEIEEEQQALEAPASAPRAPSPNSEEAIYRRKVGRRLVTLKVRPGSPKPKQTTTLLFEVARLLEKPDPTVGDRLPEEGASIAARLTHEQSQASVRFRLHALGDAGVYGMHFTPPLAGIWRIELVQQLERSRIGDVPLSCDFLLGIGVPTPAMTADPEEMLGSRIEVGDAVQGAALFRAHCSRCHGDRGASSTSTRAAAPSALPVRDPVFLMQRSDAELFAAIGRSGPRGKVSSMPAFADQLGPLEKWDLVGFLRRGQPRVDDFFPQAARFTVKTFALDADGRKRLQEVVGPLSEAELEVPLVIAFSGGVTAGGSVYVPQQARLLDTLAPKSKLGYLTFAPIPLPGISAPVTVALALGLDGAIRALEPQLEAASDAKQRTRVQKLLAGYSGQGSRRIPYQELRPVRISSSDADDSTQIAKAVTRAYLRALEGAALFDKEERARRWADEPHE